MYAIYKELHPPTVVEHCCNCNFFSGKESNLVVAGTTQLRVFRLIEQTEVWINSFFKSEIEYRIIPHAEEVHLHLNR